VQIRKRSLAAVLTGVYALFSIEAVYDARHVNQLYTPTSQPLLSLFAYVFCAWFFIDIQRGTSNAAEKVMAWASAGFFLMRLFSLIPTASQSIPHSTVAYLSTALVLTTTLALLLRTIDLFRHSAQ
jgi:hypothetical protein